MISKAILSSFLLSGFLFGFAQSYTVIQVIGNIEVGGEKLTRGSKLNSDAELVFKSIGAKAAVLSTEKGRYILQDNSASSSSSDVGYALASLITPVRGKMSSRSGLLINQLDFESRFEKPFVWISDELTFEVSPASYPIGNEGFFFVRYNYRDETINKKLNGSESKFVLNKKEFYSIDNQPIDPKETSDMSLFYFTVATKKAERLTGLSLFPLSYDTFADICNQIRSSGEEATAEVVGELLASLYGNYSEEDLNKALSQINP